MLSLVPKWEYYFLYVEETYYLVAKAEWPIWDVMEMYVRYKNRIVSSATVVYYDGATWCPFEPQSSKYFPKMSYFFSKKVFFIFWEMELFWNKDEKLSYVFSKKGFLIFQETERSSPKIKKKIILFFYICISYIFSWKSPLQKISYIFSNKRFSCIFVKGTFCPQEFFFFFLKKSYSYILRNGNFELQD